MNNPIKPLTTFSEKLAQGGKNVFGLEDLSGFVLRDNHIVAVYGQHTAVIGAVYETGWEEFVLEAVKEHVIRKLQEADHE